MTKTTEHTQRTGPRHNYFAGKPSLETLLQAVPADWTSIHVIASRINWHPRPEFLARCAQRGDKQGKPLTATAVITKELNLYSGTMNLAKAARYKYFERRSTATGYEYMLNAFGAERLTKSNKTDGIADPPASESEGIEQLPLDAITEQIQMRVELSADAIADYAHVLKKRKKDGSGLPPVKAIRDGDGRVFVWDGNHTIAAARENGQRTVAATISSGTREDAVLAAAGANRHHGVRRSHADLRNTVKTLLGNPKWAARSDRWLAETVGCSNTFVGKMRDQLGTVNDDSERHERQTSNGRWMNTKHIGRRKEPRQRQAFDGQWCPVCNDVTLRPGEDRCERCAAKEKSVAPVDDDPCVVCGVGIRADGERCQRCIDAGNTGDEEDALQAEAGAALPAVAAATGRRRSPSPADASAPRAPELQRSGDAGKSIDAELAKLAKADAFSCGMTRDWTKGKLLKAARLIVQRLEAQTMPPDVRHCARLLGIVLDGFKGLRTQ